MLTHRLPAASLPIGALKEDYLFNFWMQRPLRILQAPGRHASELVPANRTCIWGSAGRPSSSQALLKRHTSHSAQHGHPCRSCPASSCDDAWVQGSLKVVLESAADVQLRDWLLGGVRLSVLRTARQLPAAVAPGTTAGLEAGPVPQPSAVRQTVVADASFAAGALVDGVTRDLQACVKLMSCMPLFTASGRRSSWQEAHQHAEQVTCPGGPASAYHMAASVLP